jgi:hypothetical protein
MRLEIACAGSYASSSSSAPTSSQDGRLIVRAVVLAETAGRHTVGQATQQDGERPMPP